MSAPEEFDPLARSALAEALESLDGTVGKMLRALLVETCSFSAEDAEETVDEVFISYLTKIPEPGQAGDWLMGEAMRIGKTRQQRDALAAPASMAMPPDASAEETRAIRDGLLERMARAALTENAREALRLRFQEHRTYREIAAELNVAGVYAEKLVARSLVILRNARPAPGPNQKEES